MHSSLSLASNRNIRRLIAKQSRKGVRAVKKASNPPSAHRELASVSRYLAAPIYTHTHQLALVDYSQNDRSTLSFLPSFYSSSFTREQARASYRSR